jgi:hypothetical protein
MRNADSGAVAVELRDGVSHDVPPDQPAGGEPPPLSVLINSLDISDRWAPMLDWTSDDLAARLPDRTFFRAVDPDATKLPYRDHTIEVVLVDSPARMDEAARVAASAVVRVTIDETGAAFAAETRRLRVERRREPVPVLILVAANPDGEWLAHLERAVSERPGIEVMATADPLAEAAESDAPIVVLVEHGVVPLPGCIEAAERVFAHDPQAGGVAVKLLTANGLLEAAGGAAFADGSVEGIAAGGPQSAPWHEYVRPVPAALGALVVRSPAIRANVSADAARAFDLVRISAELWSGGSALFYQPDAVAVRVHASAPAGARGWPAAPDGLPPRPPELGDGSWRRLLARGEVGAPR